jgi:hypothetical protein
MVRVFYFFYNTFSSLLVVSLYRVTTATCAQVQIGQPWSRYLPWLVFACAEQTTPGPNWETGRVTLNRSDPCWIIGLLKFDKLFWIWLLAFPFLYLQVPWDCSKIERIQVENHRNWCTMRKHHTKIGEQPKNRTWSRTNRSNNTESPRVSQALAIPHKHCHSILPHETHREKKG